MAKEAAPAQTQEAAPPTKKKKILLIIVAVLVVALLGGGGLVVYLLTSKPAAEQGAEHKDEEHAEEGKAPIYEKLDTFTVNLSDQQSYLQVEISLKLGDEKAREKIKNRMPEVRDTLLRLLSSKSPEELATPDGKEGLAKDVAKEINTLIGAKKASSGVEGVLFTAFIIQ